MKPVFRHTLVAVVMLFAVAPVLAEETFNGKGDVQVGQELYQTHCADCHGEHGRGDGSWAGAYEPPPSDLTREGLTGERLFIATRDGGMAVGMRATMPAFRHTLDDSSIHDIVAYIQSLSD
ncbi:cytochrome c [Wenzhouxiangella sp. AB-CW3]|uniref:c-type cytochrome n=1 Tax=Wenzhouxiangella sp. AB-CW3 TaxID=2771012 RepID=UPI00168BEBE4|nr:cytochrome c [Wenzhouxiangella sp. AB-CW3]QOC22463.1 cytochrome c [Wenzhouxiangella sp. AB-CW3]